MAELSKKEIELLEKQNQEVINDAQAKLDSIQKNHEGTLLAINIDKVELQKIDGEIIAKKSQLTELNKAITELKEEGSQLEEFVFAGRQEIDTLNTKKTELQNDIAEAINQTENTILDAIQKNQIEFEISQEKLKIITEKVNDKNNQLNILGNEASDLETNLSTNKITLFELNTFIAEKEEYLRELDSLIKFQEEELATFKNKANTEIGTLETQKFDLQIAIDLLNAKYEKLTDTLSKEKEKYNLLVTDISKLTTQLLEAQTKQKTIEKSVSAIRAHERYVNAREDHVRGVYSELNIEYKEFVA